MWSRTHNFHENLFSMGFLVWFGSVRFVSFLLQCFKWNLYEHDKFTSTDPMVHQLNQPRLHCIQFSNCSIFHFWFIYFLNEMNTIFFLFLIKFVFEFRHTHTHTNRTEKEKPQSNGLCSYYLIFFFFCFKSELFRKSKLNENQRNKKKPMHTSGEMCFSFPFKNSILVEEKKKNWTALI